MTTKIIKDVQIEAEMKKSYLDYAMSVIISRALPDVRDGLKPVQRRILYTMFEKGYRHDKTHFKSARIVGDVMGQYHPHGDSAIYDAMVRMAQTWAARIPLIDGQGNFGSIDGDSQAAMRYTEAKLAKITEYMVTDLDKNTVSWSPNYDESKDEPTVLPSAFPNLLVNGATGIAVGMRTNIPTHNLDEVVDGICAYVDNPKIKLTELLTHIKGPDFPTGGIITNPDALVEMYQTGKGSFTVRGKASIESIPNTRKKGVVITEIPYQANKKALIEKMVDLAKSKRIDGITDIRDESDRDGMRIVIEIRAGMDGEDILRKLYTLTPLQENYSAHLLAINNNRPETMTLVDMIKTFVQFREEIITKRSQHDLEMTKKRAHVLIGLSVAVANLDAIIGAIRKSNSPGEARTALMSQAWAAKHVEPFLTLIDDTGTFKAGKYTLTEEQAQAILDLKLQRLTGLEREKIESELSGLISMITKLNELLGSKRKLATAIKNEILEIKKNFGKPRLTKIG